MSDVPHEAELQQATEHPPRPPAVAVSRRSLSGSIRASFIARPYGVAGFVLLVVVFIAYPNVVAGDWLDGMNRAFIAALGAIALNVLLGVAGQLSLGSAAIMGVGAFTAGITGVQVLHLPMLATMALGAVTGGLVALVIGVVALRVKGFYLLLATIALHYIVVFVAQRYQEATVGPTGFIMPPAEIFGWPLADSRSWYVVLAVILLLTVAATHRLLRSRTGRAFRAIKDRDVAAALLGIDVTRTKLLVFVLTSIVIGMQGAISAFYVGIVTSETYTIDLTVQYVAMMVIGGLASIAGSILGALFVTLLPVVVQNLVPLLPSWVPLASAISSNVFAVQSIIYGLVIVVFILRVPGGLVVVLRRAGTLARLRGGRRG